jgi:hypothetical protein
VGALRNRRPDLPSDAGAEEAAPAPTPAPTEREPRPDAPALDVDDVIVAWAAVLPELPVATRSAVQEAQPLSVEGDVVTFGVSPRLIEAARPRFRREADAIRTALSQRVGRSLRFNLVAHEGFTEGARGAGGASEPEQAEMDPGVESTSPTSFLTESLGATVVEERQHD